MEIAVCPDMVVVGVSVHHQHRVKTFPFNQGINLFTLIAGIHDNSFLGIFACQDIAVSL